MLCHIVGQVLPDIVDRSYCSPRIQTSWTAWPSKWTQYDPLKYCYLLAHWYSTTSQKDCSMNSWSRDSLPCWTSQNLASDDNTPADKTAVDVVTTTRVTLAELTARGHFTYWQSTQASSHKLLTCQHTALQYLYVLPCICWQCRLPYTDITNSIQYIKSSLLIIYSNLIKYFCCHVFFTIKHSTLAF
jgi:hypothetical protein